MLSDTLLVRSEVFLLFGLVCFPNQIQCLKSNGQDQIVVSANVSVSEIQMSEHRAEAGVGLEAPGKWTALLFCNVTSKCTLILEENLLIFPL